MACLKTGQKYTTKQIKDEHDETDLEAKEVKQHKKSHVM